MNKIKRYIVVNNYMPDCSINIDAVYCTEKEATSAMIDDINILLEPYGFYISETDEHYLYKTRQTDECVRCIISDGSASICVNDKLLCDYSIKEIFIDLPWYEIAQISAEYDKKCREEDIVNYAKEKGVNLKDQQIREIAEIVDKNEDSNVAYNDTLQAAFEKYFD